MGSIKLIELLEPPTIRYMYNKSMAGFFAVGQFTVKKMFVSVRLGQIKSS